MIAGNANAGDGEANQAQDGATDTSINKDLMEQSQYIVKDEAVQKRNRNLFGMILGDLRKAKQTLEKDQEKLKLQQKTYERIDKQQEEQSKEILTKQRQELVDKRREELQRKVDAEAQLTQVEIKLAERRNETYLEQLSHNQLTL